MGALVNESAPQVHWKGRVKAGKPGHEMVFPNANSQFGSVLAMVIRRDELKGNIVLAHELFECRRAFVVQLLELRFQSAIGQMLVQFGVGAQNLLFRPVFERFRKDGS